MTLYRPTYTRNGERKKVRVWWVLASINGTKKRQSTKCRDKRAAEEKARAIVRRWEREAAGLRDPLEDQQARPLVQHVNDFEAELGASGVTEAHVSERLKLLRAYVAEAGVGDLAGLNSSSAACWLEKIKSSGLSARSRNKRYQAVRQFGRWLVKTRRLGHDPFETLSPLNEQADRCHVRRALTSGELGRLLAAAARRPLEKARERRVTKGVSEAEETRLLALGQTRALTYALAAGTGLRRSELRQLRWCDVDLKTLWLCVPAPVAKSRRAQRVPLRRDLAQALESYRPKSAATTDTVIPAGLFPNLRTFKADLKEAKIARVDEEGRVVDFHALRVTFVTSLAEAGVHPRTAQALARHASVETTMQQYTDLHLLDLHGAAEAVHNGESLLAPMLAPKPVSTPPNASSRCTTGGGDPGKVLPRAKPRRMREEAILCGTEDGGSDGTRTRDLRLDRPALVTAKCWNRRRLRQRLKTTMSPTRLFSVHVVALRCTIGAVGGR